VSLDKRKAAILQAVVEEYIDTAQPVGSGRVARAPGVDVSSATVRNEMAVLEQEGFLEQPHTSAGRVPTDKGYRFFVDTLGGPGPLDQLQRRQVSTFFDHSHGELERMLEDTSYLLSNLTDYAALVVGPAHQEADIRSVQLVGLSERVALLVVVLANGLVEKHTIELPHAIDDIRIGAATAHLCEHLVGGHLRDLPKVGPTGDAATDQLLDLALDALREVERETDPVYVGGTGRMASAFDAIDTVKQVLTILEQHLVVVGLLRDVIDRGLQVAIGTETGIQPLAGCALVVAPYEVAGEAMGTVGVLGPTRMDYPQTMAAVTVVGRRLGTHLSEA
jgi:heat-inducible transcriptional repressor